MEYHLAGEESLDHLLDILRDLQFQIDFVHRDGKKWTAPRLQRITTALTVCSSKSVSRLTINTRRNANHLRYSKLRSGQNSLRHDSDALCAVAQATRDHHR